MLPLPKCWACGSRVTGAASKLEPCRPQVLAGPVSLESRPRESCVGERPYPLGDAVLLGERGDRDSRRPEVTDVEALYGRALAELRPMRLHIRTAQRDHQVRNREWLEKRYAGRVLCDVSTVEFAWHACDLAYGATDRDENVSSSEFRAKVALVNLR